MKKILILCGGRSTEHQISLVSCTSIVKNLDKDLFDTTVVIIDKNDYWYEYQGDYNNLVNWKDEQYIKIENIINYIKHFDVVFPIIHGNNGEDGKLQGMMDLFNIKYVGCKTTSSALCMDKDFSKIIFTQLGIPQIPYITIKDRKPNIKNILKKIEFPLIIKPANGGSSIGINKARNKKELKKAIRTAFRYDEKIIVEKFIKARELECAVLEADNIYMSEIGEIVVDKNEAFYDFNAKYINNSSKLLIPSNIPINIKNEIYKYTKTAFNGVDGKGLARVDFLYDEENNKLYLNEINTLPGFTSISMYPQLFMKCGLSYSELLTCIIRYV